MALPNLCEFEDVDHVVPDTGLSTGSDKPEDHQEIIGRKIEDSRELLELEMLSRIQSVKDRFDIDDEQYTADEVLDSLTATSKTRLKQTHIAWCRAEMLKEGEEKFRYLYKDAGDQVGKLYETRKKEAMAALDQVWNLLRYDVDGDGAEQPLERIYRTKTSSVRTYP